MSGKNYYVTTPIYYVNDKPHLGHAYTTIAADVLSRYYRLKGYNTMFLTGTDEHGQKVEKSAEAAGIDPQEFCNQVSQHFRDLMPILDVEPDQFIRTTEERHKKAATALWQRLMERDQIYLSKYAGWYSTRDETFYNEDDLVDGKAPTGSDVQWVEEPSYFFRLSNWQEPLLKFYDENPEFIGPDSRRNEVISFVKRGLRDLSVSRSTIKWGVPVPNDPDHVMYVWIDALTNYITALGFPDESSAALKNFWPEAIHLIGKDILIFHTVYWPAFLLAAGLTPPKRVFAHGWWTRDGQKMSKSVGNVVNPIQLINDYGSDAVRYFIMRQVPFGNDADFSNTAFAERINADLCNNFGNLVQRVLSFIQKHADASVPSAGEFTDDDNALINLAKKLEETNDDAANKQAIHKICQNIWTVIDQANKYVDHQAPWTLRKKDQERMQTVLYVLLEVIRICAIHASIVIPKGAGKVFDFLNVPQESRDFSSIEGWHFEEGASLPSPEPIFPRIEAV
jgi:methionyl-tRNA synthetase